MTTTITSGAADLPEALPAIQRFEVVDCIDDKHVPAVIPKPHGPWVRYEDHIAALAAGQATAAQQGVAYAALPEPITYQIAVLKACEHGDALVGWRVEPSRQSFDASMRPKRKLYTEGDMHDFADRTHALRASHGQAPAQAAPAAVAGPVVRRIERTYFPNSPAHRALSTFCHAMHDQNIDGADMRAAMLWFLGLEECEEPTAAPTAKPAPHPVDEFQPCPSCFGKGVEGDADDYGRTIDVSCGECNGSGRAPQKEAQEPVALTLETAPIGTKAPDFGGGAWVKVERGWKWSQGATFPRPGGSWTGELIPPAPTAPQPSPAAQGDALDAERLDWLLSDIGVVWSEHGDARRAIDAARAAQEGGKA